MDKIKLNKLFMLNIILSVILVTGGCTVIEDIFEAGFWAGIIAVIVVFLIIFAIVKLIQAMTK
jgi:hypothetical protein